MGISVSTIDLIAKTMKDLTLSGRCITFGVQGIEGRYFDIKKLLIEESYNFCELDENEIRYDDITQYGETIHVNSFFKMLGFAKVDSLDYFQNEKPSYVADLNKPLRKDLWDQFDMIYDGGTLEHCFNTKEVLSNVVRLLKIGGRIVHNVPMNGWINHGFYQFSPELFLNFYGANGFINMKVIIHWSGNAKAYYIDYDPNLIPIFNYLNKSPYIYFIAEKGSSIGSIKEPVQAGVFTQSEREIEYKKNHTKLMRYADEILTKLPRNRFSKILGGIFWTLNIKIEVYKFYRRVMQLKTSLS